jgi:3-deoxy-7-phosphoheptulonate synthase
MISPGQEFPVGPQVVHVGHVCIGGAQKILMCGPCAVESEDQVEETAAFLSQAGIPIMRGGAFKPRSSPRTFQGLGREGLELLAKAARRHGLLTVSEIMDPRDLEFFADRVDMLQIGARNMQNFPLLREVGQSGKPVLLKRGFMSTIEELLLAAEYVLREGNQEVVLCERGIRTFEPLARSTLDLACVALVKRMNPMPIIVDLSHSLGRTDIMVPMAKAALACGCDGLMIEVHPNPVKALSDGKQSLSFQGLANLLNDIEPMLRHVEGRNK